MENKNILLFPGGFKPFHDGHLSILESHISNIDKIHINNVYIIISPKSRDNIIADTTLWFLNNIKKNLIDYYKVDFNIEISEFPSPIRRCYDMVNKDDLFDKFCLVTSNKDNDLQRKIDFVNSYQYIGKYYDLTKGEQTIMINANIKPEKFKRNDEYDNENISSTILRQDLKNEDYESFKTGYYKMLKNKIININILNEYYKLLLKYTNL